MISKNQIYAEINSYLIEEKNENCYISGQF